MRDLQVILSRKGLRLNLKKMQLLKGFLVVMVSRPNNLSYNSTHRSTCLKIKETHLISYKKRDSLYICIRFTYFIL